MDAPRALETTTIGAEPAYEPGEETRDRLLDLAHDQTAGIPPGLLVDLALRAAAGGDWPVQRDALQAILRRVASFQQDGLRVSSRPAKGALGEYETRRAREEARPYRTVLRRLDPLEASCDCRDFLRGALGLCKHVAAVLAALAARPRAWQAALAAEPLRAARGLLGWDPVRPLTGPGRWCERLRWTGAQPPGSGRRWGRLEADTWVLRETWSDQPARRLELVETLLGLGRGRGGATIDPAPLALLREEARRLREHLAVALTPRELRSALRGLKQGLYPYQREGVEAFLARGRLLLADDMGLGKTIQAVAACHALWKSGRVKRGLIVCPASLKPQWLREWRAFSDVPVTLVEGGPEERVASFQAAQRGFLIVNYEQVVRDLRVMRAWAPELVVLDEAQRIKNWTTKTFAAVTSLDPRWRLVLTGTPMENRLDELATLLEWVDDRALAPRWRLTPWHVRTSPDGTAREGARNLSVLRERLRPCLVRRVRQDVLRQLPARTDTVIPVELTPAQAAEHAELELPIKRLAAIARRRPLTREEFLKLMLLLATQRVVSNGLAQLRFEEVWPSLSGRTPDAALLKSLDTPKLAELREVLNQVAIEQGRKVVVFSQWRRMLQLAHWATADLLTANGLRAVFFTGREGQRRRTQNLVELHDDPSTRVLFATDAGGVGLNLQRAATCCVNLELPWNPAVLEQRIARIHRIGQAHPIDVYNLVTQDSIEARIATLVADKRAMFKGLFDGASDEVTFERSGGFLSQLQRLLEPAQVDGAEPEPQPEPDPQPDAEARVESLVALAGEAEVDAESAPRAPRATLPDPRQVEELVRALRVEPTPEGGLRLEAPPQVATSLAALLEGLAGILRASAAP